MSASVELDREAFNYILRRRPMRDQLNRFGHQIADGIRAQAKADGIRTGDNIPRHIKRGPKAIRPGYGYAHYEDDIEVVTLVVDRVSVLFVIANRHAVLLEFGWRDASGRRHVPRLYMNNALRSARWGL